MEQAESYQFEPALVHRQDIKSYLRGVIVGKHGARGYQYLPTDGPKIVIRKLVPDVAVSGFRSDQAITEMEQYVVDVTERYGYGYETGAYCVEYGYDAVENLIFIAREWWQAKITWGTGQE